MKSKALEKKENEPIPQPMIKIIKDKELQESTIKSMDDLKQERDHERHRADKFQKQISEYEIDAKMTKNRLASADKVQGVLNNTIAELEKEIAAYKEKLSAALSNYNQTESSAKNDRRKIVQLENELYEQQAKRERAEREAARLEEHNREIEENMNKEQSMRHSAERRANRNEQFQEIWKRDRPNDSRVSGHPNSQHYPTLNTNQELAAYKKLTDDLNNQLSSETNIRRHIERRLRGNDNLGVMSPRMGFINFNSTQGALYNMGAGGHTGTQFSRNGVNFNIHSDEYFNKCKKALRDSLDLLGIFLDSLG